MKPGFTKEQVVRRIACVISLYAPIFCWGIAAHQTEDPSHRLVILGLALAQFGWMLKSDIDLER